LRQSVGEIDPRGQFHFYAQLLRAQIPRAEKRVKASVFFALLGSLRKKVAGKTFLKSIPGCFVESSGTASERYCNKQASKQRLERDKQFVKIRETFFRPKKHNIVYPKISLNKAKYNIVRDCHFVCCCRRCC